MPVGAAIVAGSVVAGGASLIGAHSAAKASQSAADQSTETQRYIYDQGRQDNAPYLAAGTNALMALSGRLGAGAQAGATPAPSGGPLGVAAAAQPAGGGQQTGAGAQYFEMYPDVAAEYAKVNGPGIAKALGLSNDPHASMTPDQFAAYHYQTSTRNGENRQWPAPAQQTAQAQSQPALAAPATPPPAGTIDPSTNDFTGLLTQVRAARPAAPDRPTFTRPTVAPLDVSQASYVQSPDYQFQLSEGNKNIIANKAAVGGLESGDAMKSLQKYGQNVALGDYAQWRDYATARYDQDRGVGESNFRYDSTRGDQDFNTDRGYDTDVYNLDRGYGTDIYNGRTNDLFRVASLGQGAVAQGAQSGQTYANGTSNALFSNAAAQGNAALSAAGTVGSIAASGVNAYAGYQGQQQTRTPS
jgi:hypothetical protein